MDEFIITNKLVSLCGIIVTTRLTSDKILDESFCKRKPEIKEIIDRLLGKHIFGAFGSICDYHHLGIIDATPIKNIIQKNESIEYVAKVIVSFSWNKVINFDRNVTYVNREYLYNGRDKIIFANVDNLLPEIQAF